MEGTWNGQVTVCFNELYHFVPAELRNTADSLSKYTVSGPRFDPRTPRVQSRSAHYCTMKRIVYRLIVLLFSSAGSVLLPSAKFDPFLRTFRVIKFRPRRLLQQSDHPQQAATVDTAEPDKCVTCDVLYDPSPEPIRADVIFIHGLHGSLDKTWKQGVWDVRKVRTVPVRQRNVQPATLDEEARTNNVFDQRERDCDLAEDWVKSL
jgi:hypothetical protein